MLPFSRGQRIVFRNKGIAFKLVLFFTLSSAAIFTAIFGYSYFVSRRMIQKGIEENSSNLITTTTSKIEVLLSSAQKVPEQIAYFLENSSYDENELLQTLYTIVEKNPEIYGAGIAFEPYTFKKKEKFFAPYFYRESSSLISFKYLDKLYNYFFWDWYQIPKEVGLPEWIEPYFGEGGGILMSSYAVPFYKKINNQRQFAGVVVIDISLEHLRDIVSSINILNSGYGFLISKNGTFVTHPKKELIMNETIFSVAEERGDMMLREVGRQMIRGESGVSPGQVKSAVTGKPCWLSYVPIKSNGWSLGVLFPLDELMEDITSLNKLVILLGLAGLALLAVAVVFIARSMTGPLRKMADAAEHIGKGDLEVNLPHVTSGDEVGRLTEAFNAMKVSLKDYIQELTDTTASKERIERELKIASNIQMGILPKDFPPFPERKDFDIFAAIKPAKEVGGDFYDFFLIDEDHLCFVIGDASGKGVPAALFMAFTKTLIKAKASLDLSAGELLTYVSRELCSGNPTNMFITIFCGILNVRTGEVFYANGGHNPPLMIRKTADITFLDGEAELVAGIMEDVVYSTRSIILTPGDVVFLYTDGVTEAMNNNGELFSDNRLKELTATCKGKTINEIVQCVMESIDSFAEGAPQSDDITILVVEYNGVITLPLPG